MTAKKQLGDLLVGAGIISKVTLERALIRQRKERKKLGLILEEMGVITGEEIAEALGQQFGFKTAKGLCNYGYPRDLLDLVPADIAVTKLVFPLKRNDKMLAVAITDPFDTDTLNFLATRSGLRVMPVLTTRNEILAAIKKNYLDAKASGVEREKVLLVEESPAIAAVIHATLTREGYHVFMMTDGLDAFKCALAEHPDLILSDLAVSRLDGYGLLEKIRSNQATAHIPVILMTTKATPEEEQKALDAGFFDFVAKPVQPPRIIARTRRAIDLSKKLNEAQFAF